MIIIGLECMQDSSIISKISDWYIRPETLKCFERIRQAACLELCPGRQEGVFVSPASWRAGHHLRNLVCSTASERSLDGTGYFVGRDVARLYQEHDIYEVSTSCVCAIGPRERVGVDLLGELLRYGDGQHFSRSDASEGQKVFTL